MKYKDFNDISNIVCLTKQQKAKEEIIIKNFLNKHKKIPDIKIQINEFIKN